MESGGGVVWVLVILTMVITIAIPVKLVMAVFRKPKPMFCGQCGMEGPPVTRTRGSFLIEVAAWIPFLVPGLIYSLWRLSTRQVVCRSCGATTLLPPDSPVAKKLARDLGAEKAG